MIVAELSDNRGVMYTTITDKGDIIMMVAAGKLGIEIVKKLKFGKSFVGKKSKEAVTKLGNKGHPTAARVLDAVMIKGNKGINYGVKQAKKYPKSASAVGGASLMAFLDD